MEKDQYGFWERKLTRRDILIEAATIGTSLATVNLFGSVQEADRKIQATGNNSFITNTEEVSIEDTVKQTSLLTLGEFAFVPIIKALKIPFGNASITPGQNELKINYSNGFVAASILSALVGAPIKEETIFRFLSNLILRDYSGSSRWDMGITSSIVFAGIHNIKRNEITNEWSFDKKTIPFFQFAAGLWFWKMQRERGFIHSVAAHSTNIAICLIPAGIVFGFCGAFDLWNRIKGKKY